VTQPSVVPYSVNSPLWSDGTIKSRFIAIPGDNPKIDFNPTRSWGFPNDTVLVKSFGLETIEGKPESQRWIETRFLTKQQNEWVGYSYLWNDDQTDASLVAKEGIDREFTIQTASGERKFAWHYPSRTECMVCHSRAASFVLGLSTPQLNRDHNYGTRTENQLTVLARLGLLRGVDTIDAAKHERLADPYDTKAPLEARAKSYLHSNCAICHVEAGGGNAQMQLEFSTALDKMKIVDVPPYHDRFGLADARLIAPGHPERSVLLHRVAMRGRGQMPQLATTLVDRQAVEMLTEWIKGLDSKAESVK
jgi:uncharacterized repeat protein (TIGR03806 family)